MKKEAPTRRGGLEGKKIEKKEAGKIGGFGTGITRENAPWKAGLKASKASLQAIGGIKPDLSFVAVTGDYNIPPVIKGILKGNGGAPVVGVVTHGFVFTEDDIVDKGIGVSSVSIESIKFQVGIGKGISRNMEQAIGDAVTPILDQIVTKKAEGYEYLTLFFVVDAIRNGDLLLNQITKILDEHEEFIPFIGAVLDITGKVSEGSGIIYLDNVYNDAILVVGLFSRTPITSGYGHGLYPLVPKRATSVSGDVIVELDGKPAYDVWKDYLVRKGYDEKDIDSNPAKYLSRFLFGIPDPSSPRHPKVRMALGITEDGGIRLSGLLKENSTVWFMEARKERMIDSAGNSVIKAIEDLKDARPAGAMILSSIIRYLNMKEDYFEEIQAMRRKLGIPLLGFNSAGEFYRPTSTMRWYHNSSVITVVIPE